jgi:hypothetical protein
MEFTRLQKKLASYLLMILIATFNIAGCGGGSGSSTSGISRSVISPSDPSDNSSGNPSTSNSVTLTWIAPTTNDDGTPLTDLAGYKIYYGTSPSSYSNHITIGNTNSYSISNLSSNMYYFTIVAYDTSGNESNYSNEVGKYIS